MLEAKKTKIGPIQCYREAIDFLAADYWLFFGITWVGLIVAGAFQLILQGPMNCGFCKCFAAKQQGRQADIGLLFKGFDDFGQSIIGTLLCFAVGLATSMPLAIMSMIAMYAGIAGIFTDNFPMAVSSFIGYALLITVQMVIGMLLSTLGFFTCCLIADRKMEGMAAFKLAFSAIRNNLIELFLHAAVGAVISLVAFVLCVVPWIFLIPVVIAAEYIAYVKIFGLADSAKPELVEDVILVKH